MLKLDMPEGQPLREGILP